MKSLKLFAATAFVSIVTPAFGAITDIHTIQPVGGGNSTQAIAINDAGILAGSSGVAGGGTRAIRFDTNNVNISNLGTLPDGGNSLGRAINSAGQIVGSAVSDDGKYHAVRSLSSGGLVDMMGGGFAYVSHAYGINDAGRVVGAWTTPTHPNDVHAFYHDNGNLTDLGTLPGGAKSEALGVNNNFANQGAIVGRATINPTTWHAFKYANGTMTDLGTLGGSHSEARAINDFGVTVGYAHTVTGHPRAFKHVGNQMIDLGVAPTGNASSAYGINELGTIVGSTTLGADVDRATLWQANGNVINLDEWLDATFPAMGAKWELWVAHDINNLGLVVGTGWYDDGPAGLPDGVRGFVLNAAAINVVPEPSGIVVGAMVISMLARRRA